MSIKPSRVKGSRHSVFISSPSVSKIPCTIHSYSCPLTDAELLDAERPQPEMTCSWNIVSRFLEAREGKRKGTSQPAFYVCHYWYLSQSHLAVGHRTRSASSQMGSSTRTLSMGRSVLGVLRRLLAYCRRTDCVSSATRSFFEICNPIYSTARQIELDYNAKKTLTVTVLIMIQ